jgi:hypothetical protein
VESGDHWLGRSGSGLWKASTAKVVTPACVSYGLMGWPLRASIEHINRMLVFMGPVSLVATVNKCLALLPLLQWLAQERNWVRTHRSVSRRAVDYIGSPFSWEQSPCSTLLMTS